MKLFEQIFREAREEFTIQIHGSYESYGEPSPVTAHAGGILDDDLTADYLLNDVEKSMDRCDMNDVSYIEVNGPGIDETFDDLNELEDWLRAHFDR
jgi:hypothetical protein